MQKSLFDIVGGTIVFSIWLIIAFTAIREYIRLIKLPGISFFMTKKDIELITDPLVLKAISKWRKLSIRLFLIWGITAFGYLIIAAIIDQTIGFK